MNVDPHTSRASPQFHKATRIISAPPAAAPSSPPTQASIFRPRQRAPEPAPEGTIYTCPMHPEIRQDGPGSCPICGMALEPELAGASTEPNPELADMTRRFWIGLVLASPVVALEMGGHLFGPLLVRPICPTLCSSFSPRRSCCGRGWPFFVRGWQSLVTRNLNMFTLIAMGTGVAYGYSVVATLAPGLFPAALHARMAAVAVYFEVRGGHHRAGSARPGAGAAGARCDLGRDPRAARRLRRRPRGGSATTAPTRTLRSTPSGSATSCGCAPARRCRSTAK